jgi:hypothetical protein
MTIGKISRITINGRTKIYRNWIIFGPELLYDYEVKFETFWLKGAMWGGRANIKELEDRQVREKIFINYLKPKNENTPT